MAKRLQLRGGTTSQHSTFTGALREVTVDTDKDTLVVHDGATAGGFPLAKYSDVSSINTDLVNDTTPQLGGDLDVNGNAFVSTSNGDIEFTPNGTGKIKFNDLAYYPEASITSSSNAVAWDSQASPNAKHTTTENTTFSAPSNATTGSFISLNIQYGGTHTIAFNTVFEFAGSTAPTFTSVSGQSDHLVFRYNGTVWQEMGRTLNMSAT